jgi:hypothetical protein
MKRIFLASLLLIAGMLTASSALAQISVGIRIGAPPAPRVVAVRPAAPGPDYLWVDGYWYPNGNRYRWHEGYWTRAPYTGARWIGPHYERDRWFEGYWEGDRGRMRHEHGWDRDHDRDWRRHERERDRDR